MKTLIQGSYVVAFDGDAHRILRDGVVVYEDNEIIHVGKSYEGAVDRVIEATGKLVSPGFINIHAWAILDVPIRLDDPATFSLPKSHVVDGIDVEGIGLVGDDLHTVTLFGLVSLLKGGATTSVTISSMAPARWECPMEHAEMLAKLAGELGTRVYISHHYRSAAKYKTRSGAVRYYWNEEAGLAGLKRGIQFAEQYEGSYGDRIRTMLFPYQFDTCSPELLAETKKASRERGLIIHMHAAQSLFEFHESLRRYGKTPVHYLYDAGFLDSNVILTHLIYTTSNPASGYPVTDSQDIQFLAKSGATVAHCPTVFARFGTFLSSFRRFLNAGINMAIGTDEFPMDMIREMRCAAILGKVADQDRMAVTARDVFNAATLGGAKALGRDDLGRLAQGAKADIVVVDLSSLHVGLIDDPIKTLVYMASQVDIETVIVDGRVVVEAGKVPGINEKELAGETNRIIQRLKVGFVKANPMGASAEELFPPSFDPA